MRKGLWILIFMLVIQILAFANSGTYSEINKKAQMFTGIWKVDENSYSEFEHLYIIRIIKLTEHYQNQGVYKFNGVYFKATKYGQSEYLEGGSFQLTFAYSVSRDNCVITFYPEKKCWGMQRGDEMRIIHYPSHQLQSQLILFKNISNDTVFIQNQLFKKVSKSVIVFKKHLKNFINVKLYNEYFLPNER